MSTITIVIETENAAFDGDPVAELQAVLRRMVSRLDEADLLPAPKDSNGNTVGTVTYEEDPDARYRECLNY
jgi:hypothetical protein